ncbi:glycoside hydrolase family 19 protein [Telluria sp. Tellsp104]
MIITYPIQIPYTKGSQQRVVPDAVFNNSEILSGSYPMGKNRYWHGGVHINPSDRTTPIRAIADGELVAYRYDEADSIDPYFDKVPYSRSFVLLKHEAELGQTTLGTAKLTFYSLYMHLRAWGEVKGKTAAQAVDFLRKTVAEHAQLGKNGQPVLNKHKRPVIIKAHAESVAPTADGACHGGSGYERVRRGDILGYCGSIPDNLTTPSRGIHFEIFFDDVGFLDNAMKTVWGRCILSNEIEVLEELQTKEAITVDPTKPLAVAKEDSGSGFKKITIGKHLYWVSDDQITSTNVDILDPKNKKQTIKQTQHHANTAELRCYRKNPLKNHKTLDKGTSIVPWIDPWMRVGEFREEIVDGKSWVQVYVPDTNDLYWTEKSALHYGSDADWPGFYKLEEHGLFSSDGFIDDDGIRKLFDNFEKNRNENNLNALIADQDKLRHLIARHPTEWSKREIAKRFGRVTQDDFGASKLTPEQFTKLTAHIERLSFWEQVPGLPSATMLWHAHPVKFIEHLARCMWLAKDELELIYPENSGSGEAISHGTPDDVREKYRIDINKCCYRYSVNSRLRQAHFFGQGAIESRSLNLMLETTDGSKYENNKQLGNYQPGDGPRFKGRGFKQLTGRYNYAEYWCFKGWLKKGKDFDFGWEHDTTKRYPQVDNPDRLITTTFNCIDAGCWYISIFRSGTVTAMDQDDVLKVTKAINGGYTALDERTEFTNRIRKILL